jgi:hypothetical protein
LLRRRGSIGFVHVVQRRMISPCFALRASASPAASEKR